MIEAGFRVLGALELYL